MSTNGQTEDVVNHPSHYNQYTGFEVIDVCEQLRAPDGTGNYNRGNAFKYLARAGWKNPDKELEDLKKARFYIEREISRLEFKQKTQDLFGGIAEVPNCPSCNRPMVKESGMGSNVFGCDNHTPMLFHEPEDVMVPRCPGCGEFMHKDPSEKDLYFCCNRHPNVTRKI